LVPRSTRDLTADHTLARADNPSNGTPLVEKAESLDTLRNAVVEAAGVSMGLWLSYLFVLFYFAIAAGGVTHRDLFFESPIKLPFLSVDLPLVGFFVLAPALVLVVHAYVLLHVVLLSGKIRAFDDELRATQIKDSTLQPDALRRQLPSNIFVQYLAGPSDVRTGVTGNMLRLIAQISLVVCPVGLLVLLQLQFLPFHRWDVTWWQRIAVILDIALLWTLWPSIARVHRRAAGAAIASVATILIVFTLATYPGEWLDRTMPSVPFVPTKWPQSNTEISQANSPAAALSAPSIRGNGNSTGTEQAEPAGAMQRFVASLESMGWTSLYTLIIAGDVNPTTRRPTSLWPNSNRLVLPSLDITDQAKFDSEQKLEKVSSTASLRGRHLEGAVLSGANLTKVDFTGAILHKTLFNDARLQGALLNGAKLQHAQFNRASLQGASLDGAELQHAEFEEASLQGASMHDAKLQDATFRSAGLQGAFLNGAELQGASFKFTELEAASLTGSKLQGASFAYANLQAVSFDSAELQGASFEGAHLEGASLYGADVKDADLTSTFVWRVDVRTGVKNLLQAKLQPCLTPNACSETRSPFPGWFNGLKMLIQGQVPGGICNAVLLPESSGSTGLIPTNRWTRKRK
jgi:uncharacterized protein YjbI with pentapeptide repeats